MTTGPNKGKSKQTADKAILTDALKSLFNYCQAASSSRDQTMFLNTKTQMVRESFINHVDRAAGRGVSEKTIFVHMGGGRG